MFCYSDSDLPEVIEIWLCEHASRRLYQLEIFLACDRVVDVLHAHICTARDTLRELDFAVETSGVRTLTDHLLSNLSVLSEYKSLRLLWLNLQRSSRMIVSILERLNSKTEEILVYFVLWDDSLDIPDLWPIVNLLSQRRFWRLQHFELVSTYPSDMFPTEDLHKIPVEACVDTLRRQEVRVGVSWYPDPTLSF
ncbi:hypothetical protein OBBRIDRAFT_830104 [Obba rivulosa]|uniref:Uncharacterized protein n=1 Tax=Obba rivulosa TaxID=1052685 RepID=A0A8E2J7M4_9APHY|nr:hypothetical protein OBBRIDRAFT_830104 [Obba rivulosa]